MIANLSRATVALTGCLVAGTLGRSPAAEDTLKGLLVRTAAYVDTFERAFSSVIGQEIYDQASFDSTGSGEVRQLESEIFFVGFDQQREWLTVRNVTSVNGAPIPDSTLRIQRALAGDPYRTWARLKLLADESARFNIGPVQRNFSEPTLAVVFLDSHHQSRFKFTAAGSETIEGRRVTRLSFRETARPTVIRGATLRENLPAHGSVLVSDEGAVWASDLIVGFGRGRRAQIQVKYRWDPRLELLVPATLEETYEVATGRRRVSVTGKAVYSNFRRFETSIRILPQ